MREGFDKEIDSLLRRTARASAGAHGNGAGASRPDSHLDADELAAFAEGALPEAARMNAVSHLADCGDCRSLAVNLTRAAGVESELEKRAAAAASPSTSSAARESKAKESRGWLASLFAPRALRYVTPVLALCLVAAVSYVALRSRGDRNSVARLETGNSSARPSITTSQNGAQPPPEGLSAPAASANANSSTTTTGAEGPTSNDKSVADAPALKPENKDAKEDAPDGSAAPAREKARGEDAEVAAPQPPARAADGTLDAEAPKEIAKSAPVESAPASKAGEHMKAGLPPPAQTNEEMASNMTANEAQQQQQRAAQKRAVEPQAPDGSRNRSRSTTNDAAGGGALAGSPRDDRDARQRRDGPAARSRGRSEQDAVSESERKNTSDESRAVAGHRFRREGGAWVDVNYKSSMASTGVRRGTDAYRALVADLPEVGRVAEQLGGEVIVVVRGRAYRIR
jgi:hypothetical protein